MHKIPRSTPCRFSNLSESWKLAIRDKDKNSPKNKESTVYGQKGLDKSFTK